MWFCGALGRGLLLLRDGVLKATGLEIWLPKLPGMQRKKDPVDGDLLASSYESLPLRGVECCMDLT